MWDMWEKGEGPENASSGRTRRSRFSGEASSRRVFARATFSMGLPSSGANWRHAMRMLERKVRALWMDRLCKAKD